LKTIVILRCGDLRCALNRAAVNEIAPFPALVRSPSLPASVEGVLNLAGEAVLVVSLGKLMGVSATPSIDPLYHHVAILGGTAAGVGLLVDRVEDIVRIDQTDVVPASKDSSVNDCVIGQIEFGGGSVFLLDANRIFLAAEQARLADIRQAEQARLEALRATT
jgi:chemotaxis signal transduction protein